MRVPLAAGVNEWGDIVGNHGRPYRGPVYSLDVQPEHTYAANGVVTKNSIYSWRGADSALIRSFDKLYPDAKIIKLEQNYRSHSNIVEGAAAVIGAVEDRAAKRMFTTNQAGAKIRVVEAHDERDEGQYIASEILSWREKGGTLNDCAVLYRVNQLSRSVEMELRNRDVRYRVVGGLRFFQRGIIKDVIAYARLLWKTQSDVDFVRLIDTPPCGIGDGTVSKLRRFAATRGMSLYGALEHVGRLNEVREKEKAALSDLRARIQAMRAGIDGVEVKDLVQHVTTKSGINKWLDGQLQLHKHTKPNKAKTLEVEAKIANLREMITDAARWQERREQEGESVALRDYLERVALLSSDEEDESRDAVTLMTIHAAKGLEFHNVFVIGCEEGFLPAQPDKKSAKEIDEEFRLMYVAMTRAAQNLHLLRTRERWTQGQKKEGAPSRFLQYIPEEITLEIERPYPR